MAQAIISIIGSLLLVVIGIWKYFGRKNAEKRKQAEQARKDLDEANQNNDSGKFIDAFGKIN